MIPRANILAWLENAPWVTDGQIEQDLIISRILVEIFSDPFLRQELSFRGGTALHKLFFKAPLRYSEDIDLVRMSTGPIKEIVDTMRDRLDPWLGVPVYRRNAGSFKIYYKFETEIPPITEMRVKIEINTRESFTLLGIKQKHFAVDSPWFTSSADIATYELEELLATKLRALYQRRKGRDLFDLAAALEMHTNINIDKIIKCFDFYLGKENKKISADVFMANLDEKLNNTVFTNDIRPLLARTGFPQELKSKFNSGSDYDVFVAAAIVRERVIAKLG